MITNLIQAIVLLAVMLTLEWRLTHIGVVILPLLTVAARRLGERLREIARPLDLNANMNAMANVPSISAGRCSSSWGALTKVTRFDGHIARVRDSGVQRLVTGTLCSPTLKKPEGPHGPFGFSHQS
jgi:hypothetical protein